MSNYRTIIVTLASPAPDIDPEEIASFVADALCSWGGQFHPDDPLFDGLKIAEVRLGRTGPKYDCSRE